MMRMLEAKIICPTCRKDIGFVLDETLGRPTGVKVEHHRFEIYNGAWIDCPLSGSGAGES